VQGEIEIRGRYAPEEVDDTREKDKFILTLFEAKNLAKADTFGLSDPFCIVKLDERIVGQTEVISNDLNPVWRNANFDISFPVGEDALTQASVLEILVYDSDLLSRGDFLGCIMLQGRALAHLFYGQEGADRLFPLLESESAATTTDTKKSKSGHLDARTARVKAREFAESRGEIPSEGKVRISSVGPSILKFFFFFFSRDTQHVSHFAL
jgi:hypothetical protein